MRHFTGNRGKTQPHPVFIPLGSANIDFNGEKTKLVIPVKSGDDQLLLCFPKLHEGTPRGCHLSASGTEPGRQAVASGRWKTQRHAFSVL